VKQDLTAKDAKRKTSAKNAERKYYALFSERFAARSWRLKFFALTEFQLNDKKRPHRDALYRDEQNYRPRYHLVLGVLMLISTFFVPPPPPNGFPRIKKSTAKITTMRKITTIATTPVLPPPPPPSPSAILIVLQNKIYRASLFVDALLFKFKQENAIEIYRG